MEVVRSFKRSVTIFQSTWCITSICGSPSDWFGGAHDTSNPKLITDPHLVSGYSLPWPLAQCHYTARMSGRGWRTFISSVWRLRRRHLLHCCPYGRRIKVCIPAYQHLHIYSLSWTHRSLRTVLIVSIIIIYDAPQAGCLCLQEWGKCKC
jgi:hypothetical protein